MDKPFRRLTDAEFRQLTPLEKRAYVDEAMKLAEAMRDAELIKPAQPRNSQDSPR